jgi:hypothetical protein
MPCLRTSAPPPDEVLAGHHAPFVVEVAVDLETVNVRESGLAEGGDRFFDIGVVLVPQVPTHRKRRSAGATAFQRARSASEPVASNNLVVQAFGFASQLRQIHVFTFNINRPFRVLLERRADVRQASHRCRQIGVAKRPMSSFLDSSMSGLQPFLFISSGALGRIRAKFLS